MENHDTTETAAVLKEEKLAPKRHNENGEEILDPTPMQPPLGYKKSPSLHEQITQAVRLAKLQLLENASLEETEEEADDFEVGEDFEPLSPYENDHIPTVKKLREQVQAINKKIREAQTAKAVADYKKKHENRSSGTPAGPPSPTPELQNDVQPTTPEGD